MKITPLNSKPPIEPEANGCIGTQMICEDGVGGGCDICFYGDLPCPEEPIICKNVMDIL